MTNEEKRSLSYFHFEKGDVTRWTKWESMYDDISKNHPEILEALNRYKSASKYLDFVIKSECEVDYEDE